MSVYLADETHTLAAGARLAAAIHALPRPAGLARGLQLHLHGDLGAGKTTLVRGMLRALGVAGTVKSPTYTLVEPYEAAALHIYHFDLYRIADVEELELMGAREHFREGAVCLFEWPERGAGWLPAPDLSVTLQPARDGRDLQARGRGDAGQALARALVSPENS